MKRIFYILTLLLMSGVIWGCSSDDSNEYVRKVLEVKSSETSFDMLGGAGYIEVVANGVVTAKANQAWINTSVSGKKVTVSVDKWTDPLSRSGIIIVTADGVSAEVPVTQNGIELITDVNELIFDYQGGSQQVTVTTSSDQISVDLGDATWLSSQIIGNKVTFTAARSSSPLKDAEAVVRINSSPKGFGTAPILVTLKKRPYDWVEVEGTYQINGLSDLNANLGAAVQENNVSITKKSGDETKVLITNVITNYYTGGTGVKPVVLEGNIDLVTGKISIPNQNTGYLYDGVHMIQFVSSEGAAVILAFSSPGNIITTNSMGHYVPGAGGYLMLYKKNSTWNRAVQ